MAAASGSRRPHLTRWLDQVAKASIRPSTYVRYRQIVDGDLVPALGQIRLTALRPDHVQGMLNDRAAKVTRRGVVTSAQTVSHIRAVLRTALNQAVRENLIVRNPAGDAVRPPRIPKIEHTWLEPAQARQFLAAAKGDRLEALYVVALMLGLRQGELLGLRWGLVDLDGGRLRVTQALQKVEGALTLVEVKTARSHRTLDLPATVVEALRQHRTRQDAERSAVGEDWQDSGLVFVNEIGGPLDGDTLRRDFAKLLERAGLPRMRFHDLRHSCGSLLLAQGVPGGLRTVMEVLGHSNYAMTAHVYTHIGDRLRSGAAAAMDALAAGA